MTRSTEKVPAAATAATPSLSVLSGGRTAGSEQTTVQDLFSSIPKVGGYRTEDHRYFVDQQGPFPNVTGILGILDKPALVAWAKREVAKSAVMRWEEISQRLEQETPAAIISWLSSLPDYQRDEAAALGSDVHRLADLVPRQEMPLEGAESDSAAFQVADGTLPYVEAFRGFLDRYSASSIVSSEKMVFNLTEGYAGTYDLLMQIEDPVTGPGLWLIDIKTSKGLYPEYALQLMAYARAEFISLPDDPTRYPMPKVDRTGVLHLRPDLYTDTGWRLVEYVTGDRDFIAFLACLDLYQWKKEGRFSKKHLIYTEGR